MAWPRADLPINQQEITPNDLMNWQNEMVLVPAANRPGVVASNPPSEKTTLGWYNAKTEYGAKGDGVTNDSVAVQAAVTAAAAAGGGFVVCPPGTYLLNQAITGLGGVVSFIGFNATFTGAGASSVTTTLVNWIASTASLSFGTGTPGGIDYPLWSITPSVAARGRQGASYAETTFNGGIVDPVLCWGYNITGGGTLPMAGEPGIGWFVEGYYDDSSGAIKMESYLQIIQSDGLHYQRPIFFQYNRTTNLMSAALIAAPLFQVLNRFGDQASTNIMDVSANLLLLYAATAGAANNLRIKAATGQTAQLNLGFNAVDDVLKLSMASAAVGQMQFGAASQFWFFNAPNGFAGNSMSVGVQDNTAAGVFAVGSSNVGVMGLVTRGKAAQNASLFEAQDENSAAHVKITKGHSTLNASLVVGKAALATTATDGFLYLPTCAGTPTGVPTTQTGTAAHVYDTTAHKLWVYDAGWKGVLVA